MSSTATSTTPTHSAMLVHLAFHTGTQSGNDAETTDEICKSKNATEKGLRASVRYICKEAYEPILKLKGEFKKKIERITTPYGINGVYLAKPSAVEKILALRDEYMPAFQILKASHLLENYDEWQTLTREQTGDAYKAERFPTREQLDSSCRWEISIMPIPESDLLRKIKELDSTIIDELVKSNEARVQELFAKSKAEVYARMIEPLQHMVNVLSKEGTKIYETLVGNMADIVDAVGDTNYDNDPELSTFATQASEMLKNIDTETLRKDPVIRKETADKAQAILNTFGAMGKRRFAA